jgi:hypothetical protein
MCSQFYPERRAIKIKDLRRKSRSASVPAFLSGDSQGYDWRSHRQARPTPSEANGL